MRPNIALLHQFLREYFDDEELTSLCFEYFPEVYQDFSVGMRKVQKVRLLLDFCQRQGRLDELMAVLEQKRPGRYEEQATRFLSPETKEEPSDLALLRSLLDDLPYIKQLEFHDVDFQAWHNTVSLSLPTIFGAYSPIVAKYENIAWRTSDEPEVADMQAELFARSCIAAEGLLKAAIRILGRTSVQSNTHARAVPDNSIDDSETERNPTAFVSYSWDDEHHKEWVAAFAARLRRDGVDVKLDQWETAPGDQLPAFMERAIRENDYVLIVCTPRYKARSEGRLGGVGYEGDIMTGEVINTGNQRKFIPILLRGSRNDAIPNWLSGKYYIDLSGDLFPGHGYHDLLMTLHRTRPSAPPLGPAPKSRKTVQSQQTVVAHSVTEHDEIRIERVIVDEVGEPRMDGTPGSALYRIPFQLSRRPSSQWAVLFEKAWDRPSRFTTRHRPGIAKVEGDRIILDGTTIEEVEEYHRDTLVLVVDYVNELEREQHKAKMRRAQDDKRRRSESHRNHVGEVASRLKFDLSHETEESKSDALLLYYYDNPPYNSIEMHYVGEGAIKDVRVWKVYTDKNEEKRRVRVEQFFPANDLRMIWYHVPVNVLRKNDLVRFHLIGENHTLDGRATVEVLYTSIETGERLRKREEFELKR